jgi:hypothetical protein
MIGSHARAESAALCVGGWRDRPGFCGRDRLDQPSGALDAAGRAELSAVAVRTKLAHDLYAALADRYAPFPAGLAHSLTMRLVLLRALLSRHGVDDPTLEPAGSFPDEAVQAEYERLVVQGGVDRAAAVRVVRDLERRTAQSLSAALARTSAADVRQVYLHLLVAAERQSRMAQAWGGR